MRAVKALATLDGVVPGDHVCWKVDGAPGLTGGLESFVADGTLYGDRLVIVGSPTSLTEVGRLRSVPESVVMIDTREEPGSLALTVDREVQRARNAGYPTTRVLACREPGARGLDGLVDEELGFDETAALSGATVVCAYLPGSWSRAEWEAVMCVHPQTVGSRPELPGFQMFRLGNEDWKVSGVIDADGAHAFATVLRSAFRRASRIRLRFDEVKLIDAAGMRALVDAATHLPDRRVIIEGANRLVKLSWDLSGYAGPRTPVEVLA
ncbi:MEDS domain-containing protein [Streptomyces sp. NPDC058623]|uniref:MEDS domain-containing protein n=1 Tax=Streptomyces sp. NPDC058623 TaxID=3346563 RepID=UPI00365EA8B8